ncbi:MAG TPA: cytochrome d ubiquinol oxidase subunit II [Terriglobales bacterium]|nr:cytochrome d ubiquinol oxidase subunit II [Terriglobales bacterium]
METLWFLIVALMLVAYVVLDGFDLGAGAIHLIAGKTDAGRTAIIRAIGPVWDGNEVWLLATGGTLYFAFPLLYASSFQGFYLPLMIVLWLLMLRAIGIEFRAHSTSEVWRGFFDVVFCGASALLAVFFGAALGNVVRGVPLGKDGLFFLPLWTNWRVGPEPGILDWYTVLSGVLALVALTVHGALYIGLKTEGDVNTRARKIASALWPVQLGLTLLSLFASVWANPALATNFKRWPIGVAIPVLVFASLFAMWRLHAKGNEKYAFLSSCAYLALMLGGAAFAAYPNVLLASGDPANNLTIYNTATGAYGMKVGFVWWSIGIVIAIGYFVFLFKMFKGKVDMAEGGYGH